MGDATEKPLDTSPQTLITFPWFVRALRGHTLAHWVPTLVIFGNLFAKIVSWVQTYLDRWAEDLVLTLKVSSDDTAYTWLFTYLVDGLVWDDISEFKVTSNIRPGAHGDFQVPNDTPFLFRFKGTLCQVRHTNSAGYNHLTIKFFARNHQLVRDLMTAVYDYHLSQQEKPVQDETPFKPTEVTLNKYTPSTYYEGSWNVTDETIERRTTSMIIPDGAKEALIKDIEEFAAAKESHLDMGLPHRRRYLLHGPAGTGKMTTIYAVAADLRKNVCRISPDFSWLNDSKFAALVSNVPKGDIVVIENVDAVFPPRGVVKSEETPETCPVSLGGLLSAIEGKDSDDGKIVFVVSKYLNPDPILLRKGRIDFPLKFTYATREQIIDLFKYTFRTSNKVIERPMTPPSTPPTYDLKTPQLEKIDVVRPVDLLAEQFADAIPEEKYLTKELRRYLFAMRSLDPVEAVEGVKEWMKGLDEEKRRVAGDDSLI